MYPQLFEIIKDDAGVKSEFGTSPIRVFPFGQAPDDVDKPYAVWQIVSGTPENYLADVPNVDYYLVQVDVYAETGGEARTAAEALRDVIEPVTNIAAWRGESKKEDDIYRYSFDINFITER